jgi:hypothetical protein
MPGKDEKARRKELMHSLRDGQRKSARESLPLAVSTLKDLFDFLDERLSDAECDHSLRLTRQFMQQRAIDEGQVIPWLEQNGGYCDCEVIANVEEAVSNAVPGYDQIRRGNDTVN